MRRHQCHSDPLGPSRSRRSERGLTLVELLLGAALGMVMLTAAAMVMLAAGRMRRNQELLSDANEEARTALRHVSRAMAAAGAGGASYSLIDENGAKQERQALLFTNGTTSLNETSMPQKPDSLILLRYAADRRSVLVAPLTTHLVSVAPDPRQPTTPGVERDVFQAGESALITNFQRAMLVPFGDKAFNGGTRSVDLSVAGSDPLTLQNAQIPIEPGATVFPVRLIRYRVVYVPAAGKEPERGDLVVETLDPRTLAPVQQSVLARNVEDFQVQWGYDRNDDGVVDEAYSDTGPTGAIADPGLTFARVSLSARTKNTLVTEQGEFVTQEQTPFERGIDLEGEETRPPPSGYRRRVLSTVVLLKNIVAPRI